jgi:hypothetical protein
MNSDTATIVCQETGSQTSGNNPHELKIREGLSYTSTYTAVLTDYTREQYRK